MHFSSFKPIVAATFSLLTAVSASPVLSERLPTGLVTRFGRSNARHLKTPVVPLEGATAELPAPESNVTLAYVALGRGVQNYTCASSTSAAVPVSIGAIASLFDITALAYLDSPELNSLPASAVYEPVPQGKTFKTACGTFPLLGNHYFNASATPTFNLTTVRSYLWGKKTADITAPEDSDVGPWGTGAVDWLQLQDKGGSNGLYEVYRVDTAGGNAPTTCQGQPAVIEVPYAAEYWFYKLV